VLCVNDGVTPRAVTVVGGVRRCEGGAGHPVSFLATAGEEDRFKPVGGSVIADAEVTLVFSPRDGFVIALGARNGGDDPGFELRSEDGGRTFARSRLPFRGTPKAVRVHGSGMDLVLVESTAEEDQRTWTLTSDDLGVTWSAARAVAIDATWSQDAAVLWSDRPRMPARCAPAPRLAVAGRKRELTQGTTLKAVPPP
jgi:hypothetical protein